MTTTADPTTGVELHITGMTCASCAARIERKLNKLDGVVASVNYATERATVRHPPTVTLDTLLATVQSAGYQASLKGKEPQKPKELRLLVSAVLALPVVLMSMALPFDHWQWVAFALTTPVVTWGALPFHRAALTNLRHGTATMDTLVSFGVAVSYLWSAYALLSGGADVYLEVAAGVTVFLLLGRRLEARSRRAAGAALRALLELGAKDVTVLRGGVEIRVGIAELSVDDRFVVRPGERLAADGTVLDGRSAVDRSMLTGESVPVDVGPGDDVVGGTVNVGGRLVITASRVGADTQLAMMARLVEQAQAGKAAVQRLADRVAAVFVPSVLVVATVTLIGWLLAGRPADFAVTTAVAVLVIACPCALGLATPTALLVGTGRAAQLGILVRGPEVLESTRRVDTVVLDKTGTLTTGAMAVVAVEGDRRELLRMAGAVETGSEHPVAAAIVAAARRDGHLPPVTDFASEPGVGVTGVVEGVLVTVGRPRAAGGHQTVVEVTARGQVRGRITIADTVRPTSAAAVAALRDLGLCPMLLTGDNAMVAATVAREVGIHEVLADVLPADKLAAVRRLRRTGRVVAMVGDGVNDAPALAAADLGLAMGTGTDAAIEAADLTLVRADLWAAVDAIRLSRRLLRVIKQNLCWAFAYNLAGIPLAAAGLLNPMIGGAAMACSSLFVVGNSLRLRRFRPVRHD